REVRGDAKGHPHRVARIAPVDQGAHAVDVAGHQVTPEPVGGSKSALEMNAASRFEAAQGRSRERLGGGVDLEAVARDGVDRKASAVDGDRLSENERAVFEVCAKRHT